MIRVLCEIVLIVQNENCEILYLNNELLGLNSLYILRSYSIMDGNGMIYYIFDSLK